MYEVFEHTADLGLRMTAPDLENLFAEAGRALFFVIVQDMEAIELRATEVLRVAGEVGDSGREYLLFDWLNELLYAFEGQRWLFREFSVRFDERGLVAECRGERLDDVRHHLAHEVKAITYHHLMLAPDEQGGWKAEVILDI